jgi:hypothetical protein
LSRMASGHHNVAALPFALCGYHGANIAVKRQKRLLEIDVSG